MCERVALIVLTEDEMSEHVSLLVTTEGPLHFYGAPGLSSHGDARAGWGIHGGAELEWTGETHDSLTVREDKVSRQMIVDRFPTRSALLATILETRGLDGKVMWYPRTQEELNAIVTREEHPNLGLCNLPPGSADLLTKCGDADLRGNTIALPVLASIGGNAHLAGNTGALPALASIGGNAYLEGNTGALPALVSIRGIELRKNNV